jgi:hypothetical protein
MSKPEKVLGNTAVCETCGLEIICRMTNYPEGTYTNYPQWQSKDATTAHYTSGGKCKTDPKERKVVKDVSEGSESGTLTRTQVQEKGSTVEYMKLNDDDVAAAAMRVPESLSDMHDLCWAFANIEAAKAWPVKIKSKEGFPAVDVNEKSRNILAQVFYKELMPAYRILKFHQ